MGGSSETAEYDLIVVGAGSGNSVFRPEMAGWKIAIVERWTFGGTCLNRGCIPTKMFVHAAELADTPRCAERLGVTLQRTSVDWVAIRDRVFGRIDPLVDSGHDYRAGLPGFEVFDGSAEFVAHKTIAVGGRLLRGRQIVLANGARPTELDVAGLAPHRIVTSDTIMRLDALPARVAVVGGGFIGAEMAHILGGLGSRVTVIHRGPQLLAHEDDDVSRAFTAAYQARFDCLLNASDISATETPNGARLVISTPNGLVEREVDVVLAAIGRRPNGDQLNPAATGLAVDSRGAVLVDEFARTNVEGVWALGDVNGRHQLKHMANGEARVVAHNLVHPDDLRRLDDRPAPHAVFAGPQVASAGLTEVAAQATGADVVAITHPYGDAAYGWALEDTDSFIKLIGDPATRTVVGAHAIGDLAATLLQQVVGFMHLGVTADDAANGQIWIHPGPPEIVEQALLKLVAAFDEFDTQLAAGVFDKMAAASTTEVGPGAAQP